ncbi:L,D-transpeptidase [Coralliovum pocilloporae]|uniref:L,D-transpeptidase n=1 Tax=Coralliovum pocilloporae TaxID=3066369 RepID=UPI003307286F
MRSMLTFLAGFLALSLTVPAVQANTGDERYFDPVTRTYITVNRIKARSRVIPRRFRQKTVSYSTKEKPGTIVIDTKKHYLYYVLDNGKAVRYGVGVGRDGFGWSGKVKVGRKAKWPRWTPPPEMRIREARKGIKLPVSMAGGPDNPLGARALYLYKGGRDTIYRIHGTNAPWTIGYNMSSGCIRMVNDHVTDLYKRVKVGAKVVVK